MKSQKEKKKGEKKGRETWKIRRKSTKKENEARGKDREKLL